jgi:hypothetical protein
MIRLSGPKIWYGYGLPAKASRAESNSSSKHRYAPCYSLCYGHVAVQGSYSIQSFFLRLRSVSSDQLIPRMTGFSECSCGLVYKRTIWLQILFWLREAVALRSPILIWLDCAGIPTRNLMACFVGSRVVFGPSKTVEELFMTRIVAFFSLHGC